MKERIIGIDVARALAVFGMILVNFKVVFGDKGPNWLRTMAGILDGKAAATFVVLAGVGLALMTNSALRENDTVKLKKVRTRIIKRALLLFIIGVSYLVIWPADILHFHGVYMLIVLLLLTKKGKTILICACLLILMFPILLLVLDYETGWDFSTLKYPNFWSIKGFIRNLFFNGFHPVVPWAAFMLFGYWLGKQDLNNTKAVKKIFGTSLTVFIGIQSTSYFTILFLSQGDPNTITELSQIIGTHPMPPLPIYMCNGIAIAFATITACILIAKRFKNHALIVSLNKTGQLALTFYVAHVVLGMGLIEIINPTKMGHYSITFSSLYALGFSICCILFALIWRKYYHSGPLEWIIRQLKN